jgi:aminoglycoside phosphotransferase (APT) family kinase protein
MTSAAGLDERLIAYLRGLLQRPALEFLQPPVPVLGGFSTLIYAFQLKGAPPDFSRRLIVRIFQNAESVRQATGEAALQNALADAGFPVPRVLHVGTDPGPLGGVFTVMHRVEGRTLLDAALRPPTLLPRAPGLLAETHARLHALDPLPVIQALERAEVPLRISGTDALIEGLRSEAEAPGLECMRPALEWLDANRPRGVSRRAVLHLDFHPGNVLVEGGLVAGVIDWANIAVGDPAADVATTTVLLTCGPLDVPWALRWPMDLVRRWFAWRYLAAYRRGHPISDATLQYYRALRCYEAMLHTGAIRVAQRTGGPVQREGYPWGRPQQVALMTRIFEQVSGVPLVLPPE